MFSDLFWAIYWIDILSNLTDNLLGGILLSIFLAVLFSLVRDSNRIGPNVSSKNLFLGFFASFAVCFMLAFIPSKQTMYMMLGVKTTENVVESPLGKKLQQIVDAEVEGYLQKLTKEKK